MVVWSTMKVPRTELDERLQRFRESMDLAHPDWELAALFARVNQYYFTGTRQDGLLLVPRGAPAVFWVRRSFERAREESLFPDIRPMASYRDAAAAMPTPSVRRMIHLETERISLAQAQRFRKHFPSPEIGSLDATVGGLRAVKRPYELAIMEHCGELHRRVLEEAVPGLLREGINEADFAAELYALLVREGHQGIVRFGMPQVDVAVAQLGFGENSIYPTSFDGPGGCRGICPAAPVLGSRTRRLRRGDLVFVDVGCALEGYHTDKTMTYLFGGTLPEPARAAHRRCVAIQEQLANLLKPGAIPAEIHATIMRGLDAEFLRDFMGFGPRQVNFLGHGVGLQIDEPPVLAAGFETPLAAGMTLALEPKKGIAGVGMVGIENTFVVTPEGGRSITGQHPGLMLV
jgi:Xaa-Pro aminopeptidase